MFERFTDNARRSVVLAQDESRRLAHDYIGPEHVLLGILDAGPSPAAAALAEVGFTADEVRARIVPGREGQPASGHIPFTGAAKKALELSLREALKLNHKYIGAEHILLGLLELNDFPIESLAPAGFDRPTLRAAVLRAVAEAPPGGSDEPLRTGGPPSSTADDPELRDLEARLRTLRRAKDEAIDAHDFDRVLALREEEVALGAEQSNALRRHYEQPPTKIVRGRVLICYRPDDAEGIAGRLYDALAAALSPAMVVMDAASTHPDRDPTRAVMAAVASSEYILVLIGPSWLDSRTADGRRRIALDDDEVRVTLLAAQGPDHVVIPVLVHGADLPAAEDLPTPVARLAELEPVRLRHLSFAASVSRLLDRLRGDAAAA
jgi:ClpA/ClpB-like protein/TIR domain-containing protein